ncbi:MAG: FtsX-like permease family protein [Ilumatobacteraceae bacterium]
MRGVVLLAFTGFRRRRFARLALALLLVVGVGASLAALSAAWKTDHAYPDYLRRADVSQLVVNPSLATDHLVDVVRTTPGVDAMVSDALFAATPGESGPRPRGEVEESSTAVLGSLDGRYIDRDRPVVHQGRMVRAGEEAFVSVDVAVTLHLHVGDVLPLTFWPAAPSGADAEALIAPLGVEHLQVVGIGVFSDEVLPDELYPRQRIVVSPDVAARYFCLAVQPAQDDLRTLDELIPTFFPPTCSADARFFSLSIRGGDAAVNRVLTTLREQFDSESLRLPAALQAIDATFSAIPSVTSEEANRIQVSLEPGVTALRLLGLTVLIATVLLVAISTHRSARDMETDARHLGEMGATHSQRTLAVAIPIWSTVLAGLIGAVVAGWLASGLGPVASVRAVVPDRHLGVARPLLVGVVGLALVTLTASTMFSSWRATSGPRLEPRPESPGRLPDLMAGGGNVSVALGVRAALRGRGGGDGGTLLALSVAAVTIVVTALTYSTSLADLVSAPSTYGWPYDAGVVVNYGFGGTDVQAVSTTLDRSDVKAWGIAAIDGTASIGSVTLPVVADVTSFGQLGLTTIKGSLPRADHEVALGARSAALAGVSVGDVVTVETQFGQRDATVTGLVVMPAVGSLLADRAGVGVGILLSAPFYAAVVAAGEAAAEVDPGTFSTNAGSFVAIDLRDGVDPAAFVKSIRGELAGWDPSASEPLAYSRPVRPAQISDVAAMRSAPVLIVAAIIVAMAIALTASLDRAARNRRRELAVLRALGYTPKQVHATLRWQAMTIVIVGSVFGVPLGLVAARQLWRGFASGLGIASTSNVPALAIVAIVAGAVVLALVAAAAPARKATSTVPAEALREG